VKKENIHEFISLTVHILDRILNAAHKTVRGLRPVARWAIGRFHRADADRSLIQEAAKQGRSTGAKNKTVAVVPVYNHGETVGDVVASLRGYGLPVILVDDGSDTFTARVLDTIASTKWAFGPPVKLVRLPKNRGKGAAVMTGFRSAYAYGASHVLQVDADGQHGLEVVPRFLEVSAESPDAVIAGYPLYDATVPRTRFYGSRANFAGVCLNTLSRRIAGPMCGFRLYPLAKVRSVLPAVAKARRMNFDTEIAVRLDWENVPFINLPVAVRYPLGGFSHFRIIRDTLLMVIMHARLLFGMIFRMPGLLSRHSGSFAGYSGLVSRRFHPDHKPGASPGARSPRDGNTRDQGKDTR